jgi:hypothetical protein
VWLPLPVDAVPERLEKPGELGAVPSNFLRGDPVEQIAGEGLAP